MTHPSNRLARPALVALLSATLTVTALAASQPYRVSEVTPASAEFNFRVTLIPVPGHINAVRASLKLDPKDLSKASGTVSVNLAKLDTGIGLRDEHARGYLGADQHPNAVFTLTRVTGATTLTPGKDTTATAIGRFELNGIAQPLSAPLTLHLDGKRVGVSTAFNVTLADHKINIPGADPTVDVKVNFNLEPSSKP
jgi:polyisoprenoid-binding protein YceI